MAQKGWLGVTNGTVEQPFEMREHTVAASVEGWQAEAPFSLPLLLIWAAG